MKKIPTIFKRNPENMSRVTKEVNPECQWVFDGEGVATRKYDGTCVLIQNGIVYKRREIKKGKPFPLGFVAVDYDKNTHKAFGWMPVDPNDPADKYYFQADVVKDGTAELIGEKVQGNPEKITGHRFIRHEDAEVYPDVPRLYWEICLWMRGKDIEGLVFHHPDGRMAKIKKRDFGLGREE
jgi:hypothetical protein